MPRLGSGLEMAPFLWSAQLPSTRLTSPIHWAQQHFKVLGVGFGPSSLWCRLATLGFFLFFLLMTAYIFFTELQDVYSHKWVNYAFSISGVSDRLTPGVRCIPAEQKEWLGGASTGFPLSRNSGWRWLKGLRALPLWEWCPRITQESCIEIYE